MSITAPELFDDWARAGRAEGMEQGHSTRAEEALVALGVQPGDKCLDLGCGNGWATRWMKAKAGKFGFAAGVDASAEMIERAKAQSEAYGNPYRCSRFDELVWKDEHFDRAFSMEALYYALDVDAALAELARVLKVGGSFVFVTDFYEENPHCHGWPGDLGIPMALLPEAEWAERLEAVGLGVQRRWRCLDPRPADPAWDAGRTESEMNFRREIGSLAILATKAL